MTDQQKERLLTLAKSDDSDLFTAVKSPNPGGVATLIPEDIRLLGLKLLYGYHITKKEQARLNQYRNKQEFMASLLKTLN